jgi:hypothetical protein
MSIYPYATLRASLALAGCCALFVLARSTVSAMPRVFWPLGGPLVLLRAETSCHPRRRRRYTCL